MEMIKLSKFKLQLQTLIMENHGGELIDDFQEKERASSDQIHNYVQKQKQSDEEFSRKITELEAELASSNEHRQKLERKVQFLEDENYLLESKHKELKETISSILQAKEGFVKAYQDRIIADLQTQLETSKITVQCQPKIEEISIYLPFLQ
ncbi:hypothetical protein L2E82_08902 [Cichorium intybus]|uniref:Uncharacterized protein n=1 Tax=Cichorium intybus TaxID=13427 RepID=A0ACB9G6X7_CICIN|nr:hypothetical protein L2E82_08902 [Cichorium intybus]